MANQFERKPVLQDAADRGVKFISSHERGTVIPWASYDAVIGWHHLETAGRLVWKKVVRMMREQLNTILYVHQGDGFELLTDAKAAKIVPSRRSRRAARQLYRGIRESEAVDLGKLESDVQRLCLVRSMDTMRQERNTANAVARENEKMTSPETIPVRKIQPKEGKGNE